MAYENVNPNLIRSSLNNCKGSLNSLSKYISELSSDTASWDTNAKTNFINMLNKLETKNNNLKNKLSNYITIVNYMEEYKNAQNTTSTYQTQINNKTKELEQEKVKQRQYKAKNEENTPAALENKRKIKTLTSEITTLNEKMKANDSNLYGIKAKIDELI